MNEVTLIGIDLGKHSFHLLPPPPSPPSSLPLPFSPPSPSPPPPTPLERGGLRAGQQAGADRLGHPRKGHTLRGACAEALRARSAVTASSRLGLRPGPRDETNGSTARRTPW